ncbi:hypothetical protein HPB50_018131 [Hyalomma asiaticum]|uniref:Uncharacterized protein n=1 Tax=Hyalomma asiaticum TaxID=266040 RepID=A0ACB7T1Q6_HYAAI|nr:hypothetical protein HPB50_018131 [Hyalomma asiaticum]
MQPALYFWRSTPRNKPIDEYTRHIPAEADKPMPFAATHEDSFKAPVFTARCSKHRKTQSLILKPRNKSVKQNTFACVMDLKTPATNFPPPHDTRETAE